MPNSKLEAIKMLHNAIHNHPTFGKDLRQYLEMSIIDAMEEVRVGNNKQQIKTAKIAAQKIINMLDPGWAKMALKL